MTEYLRDEAATEAAFQHGWFHSGDCGRFDADGVLWFEDRYKDVIKTGGENVASIEVEKALYAADPAVQETAVVGLPHERWGEAVTAVVVVKEGQHAQRKRSPRKGSPAPQPVQVPEAGHIHQRDAEDRDRQGPEGQAQNAIFRALFGVVELTGRDSPSRYENSNINKVAAMAEREGFEPPVHLRVLRISSAVRSTTLPPLRGTRDCGLDPQRLVGGADSMGPPGRASVSWRPSSRGYGSPRKWAGRPVMIDVHYWPTPNGKKVTILLEELGVPYKIVPAATSAAAISSRTTSSRSAPTTACRPWSITDPPDGGAPI